MALRLDKYLIKTAFTPMAMTLLIAAFLLILEQMIRLLDFVLYENGPVDLVWKMLAYLIPHYLSLSLPLSVFLGIVLAVRSLALSSEYDAMLASGLSPWRLLLPLTGLASILMAVNFILLAFIQPHARYGLHELRYDLQAGLLGARIPVGKFVEISEGVRLRIGASMDAGSDLRQIFLHYRGKDKSNYSIFTAESGQFVRPRNVNALILRLINGRQMIVRDTERLPGVLTFDEQDIVINLPDIEVFRNRGFEHREATLDELVNFLNDEERVSEEEFYPYRASLHYRIIHTLTFLGLPFLGVALGQLNRRSPTQTGPVAGLALIIIYHELLEEWAEPQVASGLVSPYITMWPLFLIFLGFSFLLFYRAAERPGRQSGRLEYRLGVMLDRFSVKLLKKRET